MAIFTTIILGVSAYVSQCYLGITDFAGYALLLLGASYVHSIKFPLLLFAFILLRIKKPNTYKNMFSQKYECLVFNGC